MKVRPVRRENYNLPLELWMPDVPGGSYSEPEPVGTHIVMVYKIVGYIRDSKGDLYAEVIQVDRDGKDVYHVYEGFKLDPNRHLVIKHPSELWD